MLINKESNVPFLLEQATFFTDEQQSSNESHVVDIQENQNDWFHTRCGHPRARDD